MSTKESTNTIQSSLDHAFNVSEIFSSIQGEGVRAGQLCTFIRLQGCKLRCTWCDTPYALDHRVKESQLTGSEIVQKIQTIGNSFVEFTGGEPLEQPLVLPLMQHLCDLGYTVAVETGGHIDIGNIDPRVIRIVDVKCPESKMDSLNLYSNLDLLTPNDEIKFVIASENDYNFAVDKLQLHCLAEKANAVLFSPVFGVLEYRDLAEWIIRDKLPVRFQIQLHKYIWHPNTRGV